MADERIRRALAHAIDSAALVAGSPASTSPPAAAARSRRSCRATATARASPYDPERARELLAEAGYPGGEGLPELRIDARPWSPTDALAEQFAAVGVRAHFEAQGEVLRRLAGRRTRGSPGWHADYPDPDGFYLGLLELDLPFYRDEETDAMLAQGTRLARSRRAPRASTASSSASGSASAPRSCRSRMPASSSLRRPNVHGLRLNPMGAFHLEQVVVDPLDATAPDRSSCGS